MNNRIDLTLYEGHTKGDPNDNPDSWRVVGDGYVMNGTSPQPRYIGYIRHSNFAPDIPAKREPLSEADANLIADGPLLLAELKRCYKQIDLLTKAFMMAGNAGCYMTICEECDDVHTLDDECPFICEYCGEKSCECPASE